MFAIVEELIVVIDSWVQMTGVVGSQEASPASSLHQEQRFTERGLRVGSITVSANIELGSLKR
jgi:hypothetical protein